MLFVFFYLARTTVLPTGEKKRFYHACYLVMQILFSVNNLVAIDITIEKLNRLVLAIARRVGEIAASARNLL